MGRGPIRCPFMIIRREMFEPGLHEWNANVHRKNGLDIYERTMTPRCSFDLTSEARACSVALREASSCPLVAGVAALASRLWSD